MSLAINVDRVAAVLLADGWHKADWQLTKRYNRKTGQHEDVWCSSFAFDAYEYEEEGHSVQDSKNSSTGFEFSEDGTLLCGPMLAILAVKVLNEEQMAWRTKHEQHEWDIAVVI